VTDVEAARLHVESIGQGPPLALLHGWALHAGLFAPIVPALAASHRVHAVDLPGHGHSAPLQPWRLDGVVEALEHAWGGRQAPVDVLGWSLGALVALAWARAHPARIRRLVLVGATPKFVEGEQWPHAMSAVTLRRFADELRVFYKATLQRFLTLQVQGSDEGRATLAAMRHALFDRGTPAPSVLSSALDALGSADLRSEVAAIDHPTLVVAGDRDTLVPIGAPTWLAGAMPNARLVTIPGAAHAPFLSHREAFVDAVTEFLA
jgi:pimeloyl-[acyl-carrier protein] methyl ester esterase